MKEKKVLYLEVANELKQAILKEIYPVGSLIPTEIELEEKFKVSKITVRKAVEILAQEGYLEKKSGKGTTVISNRPFNKLAKAVSFSTILEKEGLTLEKEFIALTESNVPQELAYITNKMAKLTRMYYLEGQPYIYFEHYLPNVVDMDTIPRNENSLYGWLGKKGAGPAYIKDDFTLAQASAEVAEKLQLTQPYVLKRQRYSYDISHELVEYSVGYYDVSQHAYSIEYDV